MSTVKVIAKSDVRTAKDGRQFFIMTVRAGLGQKPVNRTMWQQFKQVNGQRTTELFWERATPEEVAEAIASGEKIEAKIVSENVQPYPIPGSDALVTKYTTVMFPDEDKIKLFASQRHWIMTEHGELLGYVAPKAKTEGATLAPEGTLAEDKPQFESTEAADAAATTIADALKA